MSWREKGARAGRSAAVVAEWSDITITMLTDSEAVEEVMMHSYNGVIAGAREGSVVIDMSTISPSVTRSIAASLRENGVHMLDAPVSGSLPGATSGTLSIMVGGDADVFERCLPVFRAMGRTITHCGPNGMGQVTKLANQIIGMGNLAAMCEGIVFAARAGGDPDALLKAFGAGAANSWMVENLGRKVFDGDFAPGFMVDLAQKDLRLGPGGRGRARRPSGHDFAGQPDVQGGAARRRRPRRHPGVRQGAGEPSRV